MVKKHFTLRLTIVSFFTFLSLFLASFSCQDHEVPEQPQQPELAKINTLNISGNAINGFNHSVQFTDLGTVPVVEYGMVTFAGKPGDVKVPDIEALDPLTDRKYAFVEPGYTPPSLVAKTVTRAYDGPNGNPVRLFYRAYAMLLNNTIIYGEVKFIDFVKQDPAAELAEISTESLSITQQPTTKLEFRLSFSKLGNVPIVEYGILCVFKPTPYEDLEPVPQFTDEKFVFNKPIVLNDQIIAEFNHAPVGTDIAFYRAYATLQNGTTVFGEVFSGD